MKTITLRKRLSESRYGNLKRKGILSFLLMLFLCSFAVAQNSANIIVAPASTTTAPGQNFTVQVRVDFTTLPATSSVDAVEIHLTFDKTKLEVASITKPSSAIMPNEAIPLQTIGTINSNGKIDYAAFALSNFPTSDFDLLSINFNVIGGAGTTTPLTFLTTFPNTTDAQRAGSSILGSLGNGTVDIQSVSCSPPTATISASSGAATCNGQPVSLRLDNATGTSPYTLVVNGVSYPATVGNVFATIPFPETTIWPSNPTPASPNSDDGQAIEVGIKFRSSQNGFIKGIRFYNGNTNTGTYTAKLWNYGTSTLIASAVVVPGLNGWSQVAFSSPVPVTANTTYIASYHSTSGKYANTDNYFNSAATNGPLTALANGTDGPNGVYRYGGGGTIPSSTFAAANYWVDPIFVANTNTINLTSVTDAAGCNVTGSPLQQINVFSADCSTLPVTLLNLSATPGNHKVTLKWTTSSEINNRGFDVQRSEDGSTWTTIGFVAGAGNSNFTVNYNFTDNNLEPRKYFYRLKQVDADERFRYSAIVAVTLNGKAEYLLGQNYPNPVTAGTATIQFVLPRTEKVNLSLFDINGRLMQVLVNGSKDAGAHAIRFDAGLLSKGVYYYKMQAGDFSDVKKLTIQ
ncbi:MAG: DUF4082 domain-containing protein [Chitinophagaceae bacterium]|nr:DUF4082 domain-containing protein [Chitinophagaceae bacterium]